MIRTIKQTILAIAAFALTILFLILSTIAIIASSVFFGILMLLGKRKARKHTSEDSTIIDAEYEIVEDESKEIDEKNL